MRVNNKTDFYKKWMALELGNRIRVWASLGELEASGYAGPVSVRCKDTSSPFKAYYVPARDVRATVAGFVARGGAFESFKYNESAPDDALLIQGEVQCLVGGLRLTYGLEPGVPMNQAMREPSHAAGLAAHSLLRHYLNPKSHDMLVELLDLYPDSVVEFGAYGRNLGVMPGHNAVVWEVRDY